MKIFILGLGSLLALVALLVTFSHHNLVELIGYVEATADRTVDEMERNIPNAIRDQKLNNDIAQLKGELIDRRIKLNLAETELCRFREEISSLEGSISRLDSILVGAYPALQAAASDRKNPVLFAGIEWTCVQLNTEIDRLLWARDRDERQLSIRSEAFVRMVNSIEEGTAAIDLMEARLMESERAFQMLAMRRDQASDEGDLLDFVVSAGQRNGESISSSIGLNLGKLKSEVEQLEARNEARQDAPLLGRDTGRLVQAWDRLDRLQTIYKERVTADFPEGDLQTVTNVPQKKDVQTTVNERSSALDRDNVIIVIRDAKPKQTQVKGE